MEAAQAAQEDRVVPKAAPVVHRVVLGVLQAVVGLQAAVVDKEDLPCLHLMSCRPKGLVSTLLQVLRVGLTYHRGHHGQVLAVLDSHLSRRLLNGCKNVT